MTDTNITCAFGTPHSRTFIGAIAHCLSIIHRDGEEIINSGNEDTVTNNAQLSTCKATRAIAKIELMALKYG